MNRPKIKTLALSIQKEKLQIIELITQEDIDIYCFIQKQYNKLKNRIIEDSLFKFVFRNYYFTRIRSSTADPFFDLLASFKINKDVDMTSNLQNALEQMKLRKNVKTGEFKLEYSYSTKLLNTIDKNYPIYDSNVYRALNLRYVSGKSRTERINSFITIYQQIVQLYGYILKENLLISVIDALKARRNISKLESNPIKILDFIFWAKGKMSKK